MTLFSRSHQRILSSSIHIATPRRSHTLLGQHVFSKLSSIKHKDCEIHFDASKFSFPADLRALDQIISNLSIPLKNHLPARFNDCIDDDFHFKEDEYIEIEEEEDEED